MNYGLIPTDIFPDARLVCGSGPEDATWMFIGEAPGAEEDGNGRPFSGISGRLLTKTLEYYTELRRPFVYVTNVVKHRPPGNRTPKAPEIRKYLPFLLEEVAEVNPDVVVTLGAVATKVFDKSVKLTDDHGVARTCTFGDWSGVLVSWWHPAAALRFPDKFAQLAGDAARLHTEVARLATPTLETDYELVDEGTVVSYLLANWGTIGFDTETTSPTHGTKRPVFATDEAEMVGWSVSVRPGQGWYVAGRDFGVGMRSILESPVWTKVCHNVKFEIKVLRKLGVELSGYEDTKLVAYLLGEPRTGLKTLTKQHLGIQPITYEEATGGRDMSDMPPEDIFEYAAADADHALRLWAPFHTRMGEEGLGSVYRDIELPLVDTLARMENLGMNVDVRACTEAIAKLQSAIAHAHVNVCSLLTDRGVMFEDFNIDSNDQLEVVLVKLGAPFKDKTDSGKRFKVDADALNRIQEWDPELVNPILDDRKYHKLLTYVENFIELRGPDGRLHTSFNQSGHYEETGGAAGSAPSTGRISSSGPNLHNIPNHRATVGDVDWGRVLRQCLIATSGQVLMSADLAQEEPRIVAVIAADQTLLDGFHSGRDIYRPATEALYPETRGDADDDEFKDEFEYERFVGKTFFLAWYYGAGGGRLRKLDKNLTGAMVSSGLSLLEEAHPARADYLAETSSLLTRDGFVTSLYGRRRWITKVWSRQRGEREAALREGANDRVQATAADILKLALVKIDRALTEGDYVARLVSNVHDEVVLDLPRAEIVAVKRLVEKAFEGLLPGLDLVVETSVGENWGDKERI